MKADFNEELKLNKGEFEIFLKMKIAKLSIETLIEFDNSSGIIKYT